MSAPPPMISPSNCPMSTGVEGRMRRAFPPANQINVRVHSQAAHPPWSGPVTPILGRGLKFSRMQPMAGFFRPLGAHKKHIVVAGLEEVLSHALEAGVVGGQPLNFNP